MTLLKSDLPELFVVHLAHRQELSFRDVMKADPLHEKLSTLTIGLYYFYKRSPKQRKALKQTFQVK